MSRPLSMWIALTLVACGASHTGEPDSGGPRDAAIVADASPAAFDGGALDAGPPAVDAGAACDFADSLERGCGDDTNCVVGVHQTDCCGNTVAIGMNHSERDRFDALEPICRASYPGCGCPNGPTTTDTGETAFDPATIQAACVIVGTGRMCRTYVTTRPPDGR